MITDNQCVEAYRKHKHLKRAAEEIGMLWQTLYCRLKRLGEPVVGDKSRYGSDKDKFAARSEEDFKKLVPTAENMNASSFQARCDFKIGALKVDVKASNLNLQSKYCKSKRWMFSIKKQNLSCDFIVGLAYKNKTIIKVFLFPSEAIKHRSTISVSELGSKWNDYEVSPDDLNSFFEEMSEIKEAS